MKLPPTKLYKAVEVQAIEFKKDHRYLAQLDFGVREVRCVAIADEDFAEPVFNAGGHMSYSLRLLHWIMEIPQ